MLNTSPKGFAKVIENLKSPAFCFFFLLLTSLSSVFGQKVNYSIVVIATKSEVKTEKDEKVLVIGQVLDPNAALLIPNEAAALLLHNGQLVELRAADSHQPIGKLLQYRYLPALNYIAKPTLAYLQNNPDDPIYFLENRSAIAYSISQFPVDSITGFMLAVDFKYANGGKLRKRCSFWGDSIVINRSNMNLPEFGYFGGPSQLFYYTRENSFYSMIGSFVLLDRSFVKKTMVEVADYGAKLDARKRFTLLKNYLLWCYPGVLPSEGNRLIQETLKGSAK
jgi:hypothetical protein